VNLPRDYSDYFTGYGTSSGANSRGITSSKMWQST
jgi:hypothetical protein